MSKQRHSLGDTGLNSVANQRGGKRFRTSTIEQLREEVEKRGEIGGITKGKGPNKKVSHTGATLPKKGKHGTITQPRPLYYINRQQASTHAVSIKKV